MGSACVACNVPVVFAAYARHFVHSRAESVREVHNQRPSRGRAKMSDGRKNGHDIRSWKFHGTDMQRSADNVRQTQIAKCFRNEQAATNPPSDRPRFTRNGTDELLSFVSIMTLTYVQLRGLGERQHLKW